MMAAYSGTCVANTIDETTVGEELAPAAHPDRRTGRGYIRHTLRDDVLGGQGQRAAIPDPAVRRRRIAGQSEFCGRMENSGSGPVPALLYRDFDVVRVLRGGAAVATTSSAAVVVRGALWAPSVRHHELRCRPSVRRAGRLDGRNVGRSEHYGAHA
jgi:hypothetical protein